MIFGLDASPLMIDLIGGDFLKDNFLASDFIKRNFLVGELTS